MIRPPQSPSPASVALTFDDGPHPDSTPALLDALTAAGRTATFFVLGEQAARHPHLLREIHRAGMAIGNHSYDHPHLRQLGPDAVAGQIGRTQRIVHGITGRHPALFRPPYGETDAAIRGAAEAAGLTEVLWTVDTRDWAGVDAGTVLRAASAARAGDIVLLHDAQPATVSALPRILEALAERGLDTGPVPVPPPAA